MIRQDPLNIAETGSGVACGVGVRSLHDAEGSSAASWARAVCATAARDFLAPNTAPHHRGLVSVERW